MSDYADQTITLNNGIEGETVRIPTGNPHSYYQVISQNSEIKPAEIYGKLFLPEGEGPLPVVIVVPGSLGVAPSHIAKAEFLSAAGIAACVIDPFGARGVTSTVANQAQYTFAASAWDVLATVALLCRRPDIDPARIGAQGHSRGGAAVLSAATMARFLRTEPALSGVYAAYPWSGHQFLHPKLGTTRVRSVIGERDEWCLPQQVQGHMHAMQLIGGDASFKMFAGAQHSFDRDTPVELVEDASVSPGAPTVYIDDDGTLIDPLTSSRDSSRTERDLMLYAVKSGRGQKGARIGSEGRQAAAFHEDMMAFWTDLFLSKGK